VTAATIVRPAPAVTRNGMPAWKPYVYQGTGADTLTAFMDEPESQFEDLPRTGRVLAEHGTAAAYRRHYRRGTPLCDSCLQWRTRWRAGLYARDVKNGTRAYAAHADRGDGRPRCGVWNIDDPVIAAPGEDVTCGRCNQVRGCRTGLRPQPGSSRAAPLRLLRPDLVGDRCLN
jgi:hypothetical protein